MSDVGSTRARVLPSIVDPAVQSTLWPEEVVPQVLSLGAQELRRKLAEQQAAKEQKILAAAARLEPERTGRPGKWELVDSPNGASLPTGGPPGYWQDWSQVNWRDTFAHSRDVRPDAHVDHGIDGYLGGRCDCTWCETQRRNQLLREEREALAALPPRQPPELVEPQAGGSALGRSHSDVSRSEIQAGSHGRWVLLRRMANAGLTTASTEACRLRRISDRVQVCVACNHISLAGVTACGSPWGCPYCAGKLMQHRAAEISLAIAEWLKIQGQRVYLMSATVRHDFGMPLSELIVGLANAYRRFMQGRFAARFRADFPEYVRRLEVTHGPNGWHPHLHILLFAAPGTNLDDIDTGYLSTRWRNCVVAELGTAAEPDDEHGLDLQPGDQASQYLTKLGLEVADIAYKEPKGSNRTPWQIAHEALAGIDGARELWAEYIRGTWGHKQMTWSRNLRWLTKLSIELSDLEVALTEKTEDEPILVAEVPGEVWDRNGKDVSWVYHLTRAAAERDLEALRVLLGAKIAAQWEYGLLRETERAVHETKARP